MASSSPPASLAGPVYSGVAPLRAAELLAFGPMSTTELAEALRCHVRTARRVLERLVGENWAHPVDGWPPRFALSLRAAALGAQTMTRAPFVAEAAALVEDVAACLDRSAFVAIPCYEQVLCIASSAASPVARGEMLPMSRTAAGAILFAHRARAAEPIDDVEWARVGDEIAVRLAGPRGVPAAAIAVRPVGLEEPAVATVALLLAARITNERRTT